MKNSDIDVRQENTKLASLLQTNIKKGTKELKELLYRESYDAFEQRKSLAVKKGEEAATRLLMPMFMLLIVVMIIVMVPAVISFRCKNAGQVIRISYKNR